MPDANRPHDVSSLTAGELERTKRELAASLALVRANSPACVPILAHLSAIDAELATRTAGVRLCSCGFASDDRAWFDGHLCQHPVHYERNQPPEDSRCPDLGGLGMTGERLPRWLRLSGQPRV